MIIVPIEISARHVHLSQTDLELLFGVNYQLTVLKNISQIGQYATHETVSLKNDEHTLLNVRIVGPVRSETQVELSVSDARKLKIEAPVKKSGELTQATELTIVGPQGSIIRHCAIMPQRHLHASPEDAQQYNLVDGQIVSVKCGELRAVSFLNVLVRVQNNSVWSLHLDTDEANAAGLSDKSKGIVIV